MKFDLIISNPPYKMNLHLKILNEIKDLSDKICFIHPSTWLYDNKNMFKLFVKTKDNFKDSFAHFEVVENANELFGIHAFVPIIISVFDKNSKDLIDIYDMDIHGDSIVYKSMKAKILEYCKVSNVNDNIQKNKNKYEVGISLIAPGGMDVMIRKTNEYLHTGNETKYDIKFYFNTKQEAINFKDYLKTKMARFCLTIYKLNQNLVNGELASVPYLPTYEHNWTDEMVAKEIGLSTEELRWAINYIPDYYTEDKDGDSNVYKNIETKILEYCKASNVHDNIEKNKNKYEVGIADITGTFYNPVMIRKTNEAIHIGSETKYDTKFYFNTKQEAINFKDYLKTKMARFCLSIYKINQSLHRGELTSVPYLPTYKYKWTDEMVAKEIGLSDEELRWAINYIPDYYTEDKDGDSNVYKNIETKILEYCKASNVHDNIEKNKNKYEVGIATVRGNVDDPDFYTMIQKTNEAMHTCNETKYDYKFYFNTKQEAINFKDYLKTKMARFCLSICKINQQVFWGLTSVPYLPTYKYKWTDEMIAKEIGLSDEELEWAINYIPDYYPEDKENKKTLNG